MRSDQVVNGIIKYADAEIMPKLQTSGKWIAGTVMALAYNKVDSVVDSLSHNAMIKTLGIVSEDGDMDIDAVMTALRQSADKYGKLSVEVPLLGRMTFSSSDIDALRGYMV